MELAEISGASIAKQLASGKLSSRNRALRSLCSWLPIQNYDPSTIDVLDCELIRIWKGLFFCVWHSDKLPPQIELINRLSSLLLSLPPPLACRYLDSFLVTICREWPGIDFLRLDKFYLLIRTFLRHVFLFLKNNSWSLDLTDRMVGILLKRSLFSVDGFSASGVNYHIAEIFLEEISEFLPLDKEIMDLMLSPFISVMQTATDKVLVTKIKVNIFDPLAVNGSKLLGDAEAGGEVEKFGKIALGMGFSNRFFELASASETLQGNRKVLFGLHDRFLKLDKEVEKLGIDISLEKLDDGSLVQEISQDSEHNKIFSTGSSGDINEECGNGPILKKKKKKMMMMKKAEGGLDGAGINSKTKKKKKKLLGSLHENTAVEPETLSLLPENTVVEPEKMKKSKKQKKKADSSSKGYIISDLRAITNNGNGQCNSFDNNGLINFDDTLLSNLQKQFEKVASEAGMASTCNTNMSKKRKHQSKIGNFVGGCEIGRSEELNAKKVRFSMNKNLIWKPQNPLPPQSLRLPPSVTPRGSALKKGVSPGPIRRSPPTVKKIKVKGSSVKIRKNLKIGSPAVKGLRLLQCLSA